MRHKLCHKVHNTVDAPQRSRGLLTLHAESAKMCKTWDGRMISSTSMTKLFYCKWVISKQELHQGQTVLWHRDFKIVVKAHHNLMRQLIFHRLEALMQEIETHRRFDLIIKPQQHICRQTLQAS
jgi:hypothetical protein